MAFLKKPVSSKIQKSSDNKYIKISLRQKIMIFIKTLTVVLILNYFFYRNVYAFIPLTGVGYLYLCLMMEKKKAELRHEFRIQFKEMLLLSSTNQRAGYSIENSLINCYGDLLRLYGKDSGICRLIEEILNARKNKRPIAEIFKNVGVLSKVEEISEFGEIYRIAYEKSGNISSIMDKTAQTIVNKLDIENDIFLSLSERQFELKIMNIMPFLIMLYISVTSKGYFNEMYDSGMGICVMSVCLLIYCLAYYWGYCLMKIEV